MPEKFSKDFPLIFRIGSICFYVLSLFYPVFEGEAVDGFFALSLGFLSLPVGGSLLSLIAWTSNIIFFLTLFKMSKWRKNTLMSLMAIGILMSLSTLKIARIYMGDTSIINPSPTFGFFFWILSYILLFTYVATQKKMHVGAER